MDISNNLMGSFAICVTFTLQFIACILFIMIHVSELKYLDLISLNLILLFIGIVYG